MLLFHELSDNLHFEWILQNCYNYIHHHIIQTKEVCRARRGKRTIFQDGSLLYSKSGYKYFGSNVTVFYN